MSPDRWQRVNQIWQDVLACDPVSRESLLDRACGSDIELRNEIKSLLDVDSRSNAFLKDPVISLRSKLDARRAESFVSDRRVGAYRLVRPIGEGGMGAVWLAQRDDRQFRQDVAIKLIKQGMDTEQVLHRFRSERQVLARLQHPNIARLYDGGATEDGLPYLVMEYIEGTPLNTYCDQNGLSIAERLELFRTVCSAVQYAHQNLIVHRDLKPGNILVTADGIVKLLDFGISKVLGGDQFSEANGLTLAGQRMMTPEYASPEQVKGEPITTASDVYSLGVLLYVMLTGESPYQPVNASVSEYERVICAQEPIPPSSTRGVTRASRNSSWCNQLRGDLDIVVLTALQKEPERRYPSVEAMSEDVRRYLSGLPISARRDTFSYRAVKFMRRNRVGVTFAAALFSVVLGFGIWMSVLYARADRQRKVIEQVVDLQARMLTEIDVGEMGRGLLTQMRDQVKAGLERESLSDWQHGKKRTAAEKDAELAKFDDLASLGNPVDVARGAIDSFVLRRAAEAVESNLKDQPLVEAGIRSAIGKTYLALGMYPAAEPHLEAALTLRDNEPDAPPSAVCESLRDLGILRLRQKIYAKAEPLLRREFDMRRELNGNEHESTIKSLNNLSTAVHGLGRYQEAEDLAHESLALAKRLYPDEHIDMAESLHRIGFARWGRGDRVGAEGAYRESLEMKRRLLGPRHPGVVMSLNNLAALLDSRPDRYAEAEALYREALAISQQYVGVNHPQQSLLLNNIGNVLRSQGQYAAAGDALKEALEISLSRLGPDDYQVALSVGNLAKLEFDQGNFDKAEPNFRRCLEVARKSYSDNHAQIGERKIDLGRCLWKLGSLDEAELFLKQGIETLESQLGRSSTRFLAAVPVLVEFYDARNEPVKAAQYRALMSP